MVVPASLEVRAKREVTEVEEPMGLVPSLTVSPQPAVREAAAHAAAPVDVAVQASAPCRAFPASPETLVPPQV